jgi:hypothetical protein
VEERAGRRACLDVFAHVRDADVEGQQEPLKRKKRAKLYYLRDRAPKESTVVVNDKVAPPQPPVCLSVAVAACVFPAPLLSPHFLQASASLLCFHGWRVARAQCFFLRVPGVVLREKEQLYIADL